MATATGSPEIAAARDRAARRRWLATSDHKRIGVLFAAAALVCFALGAAEALLLRAQLIRPAMEFVPGFAFEGLLVMHAVTMLQLFLLPLGVGLASHLVPLMIGARELAFPRLHACAFWLFVSGAIVTHALFVSAITSEAGAGSVLPLISDLDLETLIARVDGWIIGQLLLGLAWLLAAVNLVATIVDRRAPGMTWPRVPTFVFGTLVSQLLVLLSFSVVVTALLLAAVDRSFGTQLYMPPGDGQDPLLWINIGWLYGHPQVCLAILLVLGIASEVLTTFARKPLVAGPLAASCMVVIAAIGMGTWVHQGLTLGYGAALDSAVRVTLRVTALPTLAMLAVLFTTFFTGRRRWPSAVLFALGSLVFIGAAPFAGAGAVIASDSAVEGARLHGLVFGGAVFALYAGFYHWWPKLFGRRLDEGLGKLHFWLTLVACLAAFAPLLVAGLGGMSNRIYTFSASEPWAHWNVVASLGSFLLVWSTLVFLYNAAKSARSGRPAGADPWQGATLEWATASPPPPQNFARAPTVESAEPLWESGSLGEGSGEDPAASAAPRDSYWPLVAASGIALFWGGFLLDAAAKTPVSAVGGLLFAVAVCGALFGARR